MRGSASKKHRYIRGGYPSGGQPISLSTNPSDAALRSQAVSVARIFFCFSGVSSSAPVRWSNPWAM